MFDYWCTLILLLLTICNKSICNICTICICSTTVTTNFGSIPSIKHFYHENAGPIIDCCDKHLENNEILNFEFLMLDNHQPISELILSRNNIVLLPAHLLKNFKSLRKLDLSENRLNNTYMHIFKNLNNLEDLNYSNNLLRSFDISELSATPSLFRLNLSNNQITSLKRSLQNTTTLNFLDLSHNNISDLDKNFFDPLSQLEYLDISFNKLNSLNNGSLAHLQNLKVLRMNNNYLLSLDLRELPLSLLELYIGHNLIASISFKASFMRILSIECNRISNLWQDITLLEELEYLNVSGNALSDFPNVTLKNLEILDISYNNFSIIPELVSIGNFPVLRMLNISGNHFRDIKFRSELTLQVLEASYIDTLDEITEDTFLKLNAVLNNCINVIISNNVKLTTIHENTFQHMNVCSLDLSNNCFTRVSSKLIDNRHTSKYLLNLQGNPFHCNCSLQWMLNDLIPLLYVKQPSLLENLRCAGPSLLTNKRMVHWYKWKEEVFCKDFSILAERMTANVASVSSRKTVTFETSSGLLVALATAVTLLTVLTVIGILLTRRMVAKRRRINRRF